MALAILIAVALLFGIFEPRATERENQIIGSYGDFDIVAKKQGMNVYEIKLQYQDNSESTDEIPLDNVQNIVWIVAQTYEIQSFHPIEKQGKAYGLIITVENP